MLSDSKLEVREVAATTLSGLLKGAKADEAARLRGSFLADVDSLLPRNRKRQKAKAGVDASGALGLSLLGMTEPTNVKPVGSALSCSEMRQHGARSHDWRINVASGAVSSCDTPRR